MVKVKITNKVSSYLFKGQRYVSGDIVDIGDMAPIMAFMEVVPELVVAPIVEDVPVDIAELDKQTVDSDTEICVPCVEEPEPKPKRSRKKVDA